MTVARAYIVGTCDTKGPELGYLRELIEAAGVPVCLVDVSTQRSKIENDKGLTIIDVQATEVAGHHPDGLEAVFESNERGKAIAEMKTALINFIASREQVDDIGGVIGAGGSGNTDLVAAAFRTLPVGMPKVLVSTVGSGNVAPYVGPSDISMVYSVTDIAGLNKISRQVLGNAAHSLVGMLANRVPEAKDRPAIALSMFGVTTPCVESVRKVLETKYDCLIFHATGTGGQSLEKLAESGLIIGAIDVTTTEVCDEIAGGVFSAGSERFDRLAKSGLPYVGSCGALDMVNFGAKETVPERYKDRKFYIHNANVTLMRTTPEECEQIGLFIGGKLNTFKGPVRFLIPEKGVSLIDAEGQPFFDPVANNVLFRTLKDAVNETDHCRIITEPFHINDPEFANALVDNWREISGEINE